MNEDLKRVNGVIAEYVHKGNNNPYEDALNFRNPEQLIELFLRIPEIPENLKELDSLERFKLVNQIESFRVPFLSIQNLAYDIYSMIEARYQNDNHSFEWNRSEWSSQIHSGNLSGQTGVATLLLLGISGIGKSTAVQEILSDLNQVIIHERYQNHLFMETQIVYLKIDCPAKATLGGFLRQILLSFDQALGNTHYFQNSTRKSIDTMLSEVVDLVREYHVGILVIDEINHLVNSRQNESELCNFLTTLTNLIETPIVFIGTYQAEHLLQKNLRTTRRMMKNGYHNWNRLEEESREWQFFVKELLKLQYTLSFNEPTEDLKHALYEVSEGILAIAVSVFSRVQRKVMIDELNTEENFTPEDIRETFEEEFYFLKPILEAIRKGNISKMIELEDVLDQIDQIDQTDQKNLKQLEEERRAYEEKINQIKTERAQRSQKIFEKIRILKLFVFLEEDQLRELIREFLKDKRNSALPEPEQLQLILRKALEIEEELKTKHEKEQKALEERLKEQKSPTGELSFLESNSIDYEAYKQKNLIGGLDDF